MQINWKTVQSIFSEVTKNHPSLLEFMLVYHLPCFFSFTAACREQFRANITSGHLFVKDKEIIFSFLQCSSLFCSRENWAFKIISSDYKSEIFKNCDRIAGNYLYFEINVMQIHPPVTNLLLRESDFKVVFGKLRSRVYVSLEQYMFSEQLPTMYSPLWALFLRHFTEPASAREYSHSY
jgi:hypothetical protein